MGTEPVTMQIDDEAARAFRSASSLERRKLEALVSIQLLEATKSVDDGCFQQGLNVLPELG